MIITFLILILLLGLFIWDKYSPDSVVLVAIILLVLLGVLTPNEAFQGFGTDFIIMLSAIFIISAVLQYNGVMDFFAQKFIGLKITSYPLIIILLMIPVGLLSSLMNNTTLTAIMLLPVLKFAKEKNILPSKLLMPLAFASLLGGTCSLIGTSTNVVGSNFLKQNGYDEIGFFEFFPIGIVLLIFCSVILAFGGKYLLPNRSRDLTALNTNIEINHQFFSSFHLAVLDEDNIVKLKDFCTKNNILINYTTDLDNRKQAGIVAGKEQIIYIEANKDVILTFIKKFHQIILSISELKEQDKVFELLVLPNSFIVNTTISEVAFKNKTRLEVISIYRKNHPFSDRVKRTIISPGDILFCKGTQKEIAKIESENDFVVLNQLQNTHSNRPDLKRGFFSLAIFGVAILFGTFNILPISIAFLASLLLILSFNVLPAEKIYSSINWRLIIVIGGMNAFGVALDKTGANQFISNQLTSLFVGFSPTIVLFILMILTVVLTQPMSNAAAALITLPIAIQTAKNFQSDPRAFAIAIILSASISMITPFEPASLLVLNPGKYKVKDFFIIGGILTLACLIIIISLLKYLYKI